MIIKKKFNELTLRELYEILKLRSEIFIEEQKILYVDQDDIDYFSTHYFLSDERGVYGYIRLIDKGVKYDDCYSLGRLCVRKDYRNKGIARLLMETAINDLGRKDIIISAQEYLEKFYLSLGYKRISDEYMEEGIVHIRMSLGGESVK